MPGFLRKEKSLEDMEAESERLEGQLSIAEKKRLLAELERREGKGAWKMFAQDKDGKGLKSGINWSEIKFRLH